MFHCFIVFYNCFPQGYYAPVDFYYLCNMENEISNFNERVMALADKLVREKTIYDLATLCAEYMLKEKDKKPTVITISEEEWEVIQSLFRIRGTRANGQEERRGRPKKM